MGFTYAGGAGAREWRRGRIKLIDIPTPPVGQAIFPPNEWGTTAHGFSIPSAEHLALTSVRLPDGMLLVGSCRRCTARRETLLPPTMDVVAGIHAHTAWAREHVSCDRPHVPVPPMVDDFVNTLTRGADSLLRHGGAVPTLVHLLLQDGEVYAYEVADVPDRRRGDENRRAREIELRQWGVRRLIRQRGWRLAAVLVFGEAWASVEDPRYPAEAADRTEVVVRSLLLPASSRASVLRIVRDGGVVGEGPGHLNSDPWADELGLGGVGLVGGGTMGRGLFAAGAP